MDTLIARFFSQSLHSKKDSESGEAAARPKMHHYGSLDEEARKLKEP